MPDTNKNGADYAQNYDLVVKWIAAALKGQTLHVLGVETDRIEEVFGFEPVNIAVKTGRVDVIARCENGDLYHIEEQRNLSRADMYRFASQHFSAAAQWGSQVTDIILASGKVTASAKILNTPSGRYKPIIIDFTERDGWQRLKEIRQEIASGEPVNLMELIFVPLYGKERGSAREELAKEVIQFGLELCKAEKFSKTLLAAALIFSNKLISKKYINEIWEEIKMLDIIEIAIEKGEEAGFKKGEEAGIKKGEEAGIKKGEEAGIKKGEETGLKNGRNEGEIIGIQKMVLELLIAKFSLIPQHIALQIKKIQEVDVLRALFHTIVKCEDLNDFEAALSRV